MSASLSFLSLSPQPLSACSTAINQISFSDSNSLQNILVFPSNCLVAFYDVTNKKLIESWKLHTNQINVVRAFQSEINGKAEHFIVTADADGLIVIWNLELRKAVCQFQAHKSSVTRISVLKDKWICCTSSDCSISIWKINVENNVSVKGELFQKIIFGRSMMECCDLALVQTSENKGTPILACGGIDQKLHIYLLDEVKNSFVRICSLLGHTDWIRDMKFVTCDDNSLLLATACQDTYIRVWKIKEQIVSESQESITNDIDISNIDISTFSIDDSMSLTRTSHMFQIEERKWSIVLETILSNHDDWIHSLDWAPKIIKNDKIHQPIRLLSASMDRSMIIWQPDENLKGVWSPVARMGNFGGKVGMTGQMGYMSALFLGTGEEIISHGFHGSFHYWKRLEDESTSEEWIPDVSVSGHFNSIMDIDWNSTKQYFLSTSSDQTTRLFAPWRNSIGKSRFYEIGRPQIHGYDINCISSIKGNHEHLFVTGAEEKVIRAFDAPVTFVNSYKEISGISSKDSSNRVESAEIPTIGLSNKAILAEDEKHSAKTFTQPPYEEQLLKDTLWPEICKLFGHANEIICLSSSNSGRVIASSCQAKKEEEAEIRLWDTSIWEECCVLPGHRTSVTRIEFSPNDQYLISVSRDMNIIFYKQEGTSQTKYTPVLKQKIHNRIVHDCSWSHNGKFIATVSRDKTVKVWSVPENAIFEEGKGLELVSETKLKNIPISVSFCWEREDIYTFAVGFSNGEIEIWTQDEEKKWGRYITIPSLISHASDVQRMRWRKTEEYGYELLTCSLDGSLRLFSITF